MEENWDEEVYVLEQIKENKSNFNKASDRLKKDKEFIMEVLNSMPEVIDYVSDELKNDPEFYRGLTTRLDVELFNNKKYKDLKEKAENEIIKEFTEMIEFEGERKELPNPNDKGNDLRLFHDLYWTFADKKLLEEKDFFFSQATYTNNKDLRYGSSMIFKKDDKLLGIVVMEDKPERYVLLTENPEDFQDVIKDVDELKKFKEKGNDITVAIDKLNKQNEKQEEKQLEDMEIEDLEELYDESVNSVDAQLEKLEDIRRRELINSIKELQDEGKKLDARIKELEENSKESR